MGRASILFLACLPVCLGCGGDSSLAEVHGLVTLDGQPVPHALLTFTPKDAKQNSPSFGVTKANGVYTLKFSRDREGAVPGTHAVQISKEKLSKDAIEAMQAAGEEVVTDFPDLPRKYKQPGALSAEVKPGTNAIDFVLQSK